MKLPLAPLRVEQLLATFDMNDLARLVARASPLPTGKYLHWDELRHRTPPEGLSPERWWLSVWLARTSMLQPLPLLLDKAGHPFRLAIPEPAMIALHHIDCDAAGEIRTPDGAPILESRERYLLQSLIDEAITSSQLEGASTTRRIAEAMLREGRHPRDRAETMIFNNYQAMEQIRSLKEAPITPARILELRRVLTADTLDDAADAGRLRRDNAVRVVDRRDETLLHQPPGWRELPERLERLCAFANIDASASPFVHPVVRAILLHFMIGYDHPFADGNGRTARALFYWAMARSGYWLMEFLSISQFLRRAPGQYVQASLHTETDGGDTTYFVLHQLDTIRRAIAALHAYLARKTREQQQTETLLARSATLRERLNHRQVALLSHALKHPGERYSLAAHQNLHRVAYQTARTDLLGLRDMGLLDQRKRGNAFVFYAPADLAERLKGFDGMARS